MSAAKYADFWRTHESDSLRRSKSESVSSSLFLCDGVPLRQVYGLTETSPIVSLTRAEMNHPACVGQPVAQTQVRLGDRDELQVKGPQVMQGYWNKPAETKHAFTEDGWFHTGDQADLSDGGRVRIKGRIKEIIVTSTGEKIAPVDLEFAIQEDPLFEQVFVCGENRPSLVLYWFFSLTYGKRSVPKWNSLQTIRRRCTIEACCAIWSNACVPPPKIFLLTAFRGPLPLRTSHLPLKTAFSRQQ